MKSLKKTLALFCSTATVLALGAFSVSALTNNATAPDTDKITIWGDMIEVSLEELQASNYVVKWSMNLTNNPGYVGSGIGVIHDEKLTHVVKDDNPKAAKNKRGDAADDLTGTAESAPDKHMIGWGTMGTDNDSDDGVIVTFEFNVPQDATAGTVYPIDLDLDSFSNLAQVHFEDQIDVIDGYIKIAGESTTTTETTTTETTTTETTTETTNGGSTTETTETTNGGSTTETTETTNGGSTTETTSNSQLGGGDDDRTTTTTTTTGNGGGTTTTTTTQKGTQTGDAGIALAVAGLMVAAGTAFVLRKKED